MKKIFVFINSGAGTDWVVGSALAEDGNFLAGHVSSHDHWFLHDMGLTSDWKHDAYKAHYPDGYELVHVTGNPKEHEGLMAAHAALATPNILTVAHIAGKLASDRKWFALKALTAPEGGSKEGHGMSTQEFEIIGRLSITLISISFTLLCGVIAYASLAFGDVNGKKMWGFFSWMLMNGAIGLLLAVYPWLQRVGR